MEKITVIGSSNTDLLIKTNRIPDPGETVLGGTFMMNAGGKGPIRPWRSPGSAAA